MRRRSVEGSSEKVKDFKSYEVYSKYRVPEELAFFVRCNGRNFRKVCSLLELRKPFDERLIRTLVKASREVLQGGFNAILAYMFSDEVNFLFFKDVPFNRRIEKLVSLIPSLLSSRLTLEILRLFDREITVSFDARIIPLHVNEIIDYLVWRQLQCFRNCLNCYAHYSLIEAGHDPQRASEVLRGRRAKELIRLLRKVKGIKLSDIPLWERRGVLLYWKFFYRNSNYRLVKGKTLKRKRELKEEWNLPVFSRLEGRAFLQRVLKSWIEVEQRG